MFEVIVFMKVVIVGNGKVGNSLAERLSSEGHDVVVIDNDPDNLKNSDTRMDIITVLGNGVSYTVQLEAGVPKADLLVAATPSDECNMLCCLVAHKLGAQHTIARVRNPEYAQQLVLMREDLGLTMAVNPELAASKEIARILAFPSATKIETFCKGRVELCEFTVPQGSPLHDLPLSSLYSKYRLKVLVCTVQRGDKVIIPQGDFTLQAGDHIGITASPAEIAAFFKAIDLTREKIRSVLVVGGSRIAYYLTRQLLDMGMDVTVVERDHKRCLELCVFMLKTLGLYEDVSYRFSQWDPDDREKYIGTPEQWDEAQSAMKRILDHLEILDVALVQQDLSDALLHIGSGDIYGLMLCVARVADAGQHIRDRVCDVHTEISSLFEVAFPIDPGTLRQRGITTNLEQCSAQRNSQ